MNTFYFAHPKDVGALLDPERARKQLVENIQIGKALTGGAAWVNHPAVKMWSNGTACFADYWGYLITGMRGRGLYKNEEAALGKSIDRLNEFRLAIKGKETHSWWWMEDPFVQMSHMASLLRKDSEYYSKVFNKEYAPDIGYFWPLPERGRYMYMVSGKPKTRQYLQGFDDCYRIVNAANQDLRNKNKEENIWTHF